MNKKHLYNIVIQDIDASIFDETSFDINVFVDSRKEAIKKAQDYLMYYKASRYFIKKIY